MTQKIVLCIVVILVLTGCTKHTKGKSIDVVWHTISKDGDHCLFVGEGVSVEQAKELKEKWGFSPCEIKVDQNTNDK